PEPRPAGRSVARTELLRDEGVPRLRGALGDTRRVGTHVGDEPGRALVPEFDPLIELLRHTHRLLGGEAEALGRLLLEGGGREGRWRVLGTLPPLDLGDDEGDAVDIGEDAAGALLVLEAELLPVDVVELRLE